MKFATIHSSRSRRQAPRPGRDRPRGARVRDPPRCVGLLRRRVVEAGGREPRARRSPSRRERRPRRRRWRTSPGRTRRRPSTTPSRSSTRSVASAAITTTTPRRQRRRAIAKSATPADEDGEHESTTTTKTTPRRRRSPVKTTTPKPVTSTPSSAGARRPAGEAAQHRQLRGRRQGPGRDGHAEPRRPRAPEPGPVGDERAGRVPGCGEERPGGRLRPQPRGRRIGPGACLPSTSNCQVVELKPGQVEALGQPGPAGQAVYQGDRRGDQLGRRRATRRRRGSRHGSPAGGPDGPSADAGCAAAGTREARLLGRQGSRQPARQPRQHGGGNPQQRQLRTGVRDATPAATLSRSRPSVAGSGVASLSFSAVEPIRLITAGESHGPGLTCLVEGLPAGLELDLDRVNRDMARRQLGPRPWRADEDRAGRGRDHRPACGTGGRSADRSPSRSPTATTRTGPSG